MLDDFHVGGIMFLLRPVLNMLVRNASPRMPMCFSYVVSNECDESTTPPPPSCASYRCARW